MQRRDYILRMIEQFGQFVMVLRKLILGGRAGSAEAKRQLKSIAQHAGLDLDVARVATPETLALLVAPSGEVEPARCWMYAETLYLDALDAEMTDDYDRAVVTYEKARVLFSMLAPMGAFLVGFPEARLRIDEIDGRLAALADAEGGRSSGTVHNRRIRRRRTVVRVV